MTSSSFTVTASLIALVFARAPLVEQPSTPAGLWDDGIVLTLANNGGTVDVPFRFEVTCAGARCTSPRGSFFNGDEKVTSSSGTFQNGVLALSFDEMGTKLEATLKDGRLEGEYSR